MSKAIGSVGAEILLSCRFEIVLNKLLIRNLQREIAFEACSRPISDTIPDRDLIFGIAEVGIFTRILKKKN